MMMKSNIKYLSTSDSTSVALRLQGTEHQLGYAIAQLKLVNKFGNLNSIKLALHSLIIFGLLRRVLVICGEYYTRQMFINLSALSISSAHRPV